MGKTPEKIQKNPWKFKKAFLLSYCNCNNPIASSPKDRNRKTNSRFILFMRRAAWQPGKTIMPCSNTGQANYAQKVCTKDDFLKTAQWRFYRVYNFLKTVQCNCYAVYNFSKTELRNCYTEYNFSKVEPCNCYAVYNIIKTVQCNSNTVYNF